MIGISLLMLAGCEYVPEGELYRHADLGVVRDHHPAFLKVYEKCDQEIYSPGYDVEGVTYHSEKEVADAILELFWQNYRLEGTSEERWARNGVILSYGTGIHSDFLACLAEAGFAKVKT